MRTGKTVKHCHGKKKGKVIKKHKTVRAAKRQHRAIKSRQSAKRS
jgi:hypothetical protein